MNDLPITFTFAGLPANPYCFTTFERLAIDLTSGLSGFVPGSGTFPNYGSDEPSPDNRNRPWIRLNPDGTFDRTYVYVFGAWSSPHPTPPAGDERRIFAGIESDVWAYDGGDGTNPASVTPAYSSGAMWEVDHDFDFRFPIGAGVSPLGTTINSGDVGGEEAITLTVDQIPVHKHSTTLKGTNEGGSANWFASGDNTQETPDVTVDTSEAGGGDPHANMPPYRGVLFIKRTARVAYTP